MISLTLVFCLEIKKLRHFIQNQRSSSYPSTTTPLELYLYNNLSP